MASNDIIIKLEHVSKSYEGKEVLHDINLYIRKGEFVTLLGPSGCGKSTTLRLIAGFLQPDEGRVLLSGKDMTGIPPYRRPLNTVFQRYALFPHLDVYDNIAFGLKLKGLPEKEIDKKVVRILWDVQAAEKGGYEHFMMKEIFEQPKAVEDTLHSVCDGQETLAVMRLVHVEHGAAGVKFDGIGPVGKGGLRGRRRLR